MTVQMTSFFIYLLEASVSSVLLYLLYVILFSKLTHFQWNRYYLVGIILLSLAIPILEFPATETTGMIDIKMDLSSYLDEYNNVNDMWEHAPEAIVPKENDFSFSSSTLLVFVYFCGLLFSLLRLVIAIIQINQLVKDNPRENKQGYVLVKVMKNIAPCSFWKWVFLSEQLENKSEILSHELVHIRERHTLDVILLELYMIVFWFNPVIYFIKKSLNQVHEYIADQNTASSDKRTYAQLILENASNGSTFYLVNSFAFLPIKKRILMLSKEKSSALSKLRFLLILPLVYLLISAFSISLNKHNTLQPEVLNSVVPTMEETVFISPISSENSKITSRYGMRSDPILKIRRFHAGIDFSVPEGTEIIAAAEGKVILSQSSDKGYGNQIKIEHADGSVTRYAHMHSFTVKVGDSVKQGELIGKVGNTGLSLGSHLHFEIIKNDKNVNPEDLIPELKK